jgi:hypothetical protein
VSSSCPTGTTCAPPHRLGLRPPVGVAAHLRPPPDRPEQVAAHLRLPLAAHLRPNPEILTDKPPPPTPSHRGRSAPTPVEEADHDLLEACGITDLDELAQQCMTARQVLGKPTARWTARCLAVVIKLAVVTRGWPPTSMEQALLAIARDRENRSPARVAEAGPWWDTLTLGVDQANDAHELAEMEAPLAETDGLRPAIQAQARTELTAEGCPSSEAPSRAVPAQSSTSTSCNERRAAHSTPIPPQGDQRVCRTEDSDGMHAMLRATSSSLQRRYGHARHRVPAGAPQGVSAVRI